MAALIVWLAVCAAVDAAPSRISIDYPANGTIFPPDIAPPTFIWRDRTALAHQWRVAVSFHDGSPALETVSKGQPFRLGPIDPDCISPTNELPKLTRRQVRSRTWRPERALWQTIKNHSGVASATVTVTGLSAAGPVSRGSITIRTSRDPVGAPVFYRDVPLMPTKTEKGVIKPLASNAMPLVAWRLRSVAESASRLVMDNLPVCANCHSFSADGRTLGMDLDGLQNNRGLYFLASIQPTTVVRNSDVIQWGTAEGRLKGALRIGFMSQVSPDGRYVATTIDPDAGNPASAKGPGPYYVANFEDYKFLQVFYPTRGILSWFSRESGHLEPLPGADDRRYVQTNAVWSPDGKYLVFARAAAGDPYPEGVPLAKFANDENETQIQYDLYRIPFNAGRGGVAESIRGASRNGMSNTFPKVSPDGRWIVYVQSRNGLLMRPDSQLYIVPASGGEARRLRSNMKPMNSWHSFSPNGRWLVFSSKSRSPYTEMFLTHIDEDGNDSPPVLIENATRANRAANLPEFVNIPPGGLERIGGPAFDYYRLFNRALYLQKQRRLVESAAEWQRVLDIRPGDELAEANLGLVLLLAGRRGEAAPHLDKVKELRLREAVRLAPDDAGALDRLAWLLATNPDPDRRNGREALSLALRASELTPRANAQVLDVLAAAYAEAGEFVAAVSTARRAREAAFGENQKELAAAIQSRLALYESHQPFHESRALTGH